MAAARVGHGLGCPAVEEPCRRRSRPRLVVVGASSRSRSAPTCRSPPPPDGTDVPYQWTSTDPAFATVDGIGRVRASAGRGRHHRGTTAGAAPPRIVVVPGPRPWCIAGAHRVPGDADHAGGGDRQRRRRNYAWESDAPAIVGERRLVTTCWSARLPSHRVRDRCLCLIHRGPGTSAVGVRHQPICRSATGQLAAVTANADDDDYAWSSSDTSVATVDEDGLVRGVAAGTVTIAATGAGSGLVGELGITVAAEIPYFDQWASSGHADHAAEPFARWVGTVQKSCARCHSDGGYRDYLGEDGSAVGVVDADAATGTVVQCTTCHNAATAVLDEVTFPSGAVVSGLGASTRCMVCHQGRASTDSVERHRHRRRGRRRDDRHPLHQHPLLRVRTVLAGRARGAYQCSRDPTHALPPRADRDICIGADRHARNPPLRLPDLPPATATLDQLKDIHDVVVAHRLTATATSGASTTRWWAWGRCTTASRCTRAHGGPVSTKRATVLLPRHQ